ncbi:MAG: fumarate hydratase [Candidatus Hecatellales archaeon]|nr:MAG: fumarate hydratase [Candidatus Hecatellales archaeon]
MAPSRYFRREVETAKYTLNTPLSEEDVRKLRVGDLVYLNGTIYTARDMAHKRLLRLAETGKRPPISLDGAVIYHAGPIVRRKGKGWEVVSAGPTTSLRMAKAALSLLNHYAVRMIIGKGGLGENVEETLSWRGAVYCHYPGGAAVLAAEGIKQVVGVRWLSLGMPEALWMLRVEGFGPLLVAIDTHGGNLYREVESRVKENLKRLTAELA